MKPNRARCTLPGYVRVHRGHPVAEHNDAHDGGGNQQLGVDAEPRKVQPDLFPKVLPAEVWWRGGGRGVGGQRISR